jgi:uncharacterized protein with HEPN domain
MHTKDHLLLLSILETIQKIERFSSDYSTPDEFYKNDRDFDAVMMNFIVIGEVVGKLSDEIKNENPHINWQKIYGLRNIIAHHYFGINVDIVWEILHNDLPSLKKGVNQLL